MHQTFDCQAEPSMKMIVGRSNDRKPLTIELVDSRGVYRSNEFTLAEKDIETLIALLSELS